MTGAVSDYCPPTLPTWPSPSYEDHSGFSLNLSQGGYNRSTWDNHAATTSYPGGSQATDYTNTSSNVSVQGRAYTSSNFAQAGTAVRDPFSGVDSNASSYTSRTFSATPGSSSSSLTNGTTLAVQDHRVGVDYSHNTQDTTGQWASNGARGVWQSDATQTALRHGDDQFAQWTQDNHASSVNSSGFLSNFSSSLAYNSGNPGGFSFASFAGIDTQNHSQIGWG